MTDQGQDALPAVAQEPKGPPVPEVSGGSAEAGSAPAGPDVSALAKELAAVKERLEKLPEDIDARFKSGKDKRFAKVDEIYEWVKAAGGDVSKIADKVERQQLQDRLDALEGKGSAGDRGGSPGQDRASITAKFLNDLKEESGVEFSDQELQDIWKGKRYPELEDAFKDVRRVAFKKARQANVGAGSITPEGGGSAPVSGDVDRLTQELTALSQSGAPAKKIEEAAAKLREALARK